MNRWLRLALVCLLVSGIIVVIETWVTFATDGPDEMLCTGLPTGHLLPCRPSVTGFLAVLFKTMVYAIGLSAFFSPFALIGKSRRDRKTRHGPQA